MTRTEKANKNICFQLLIAADIYLLFSDFRELCDACAVSFWHFIKPAGMSQCMHKCFRKQSDTLNSIEMIYTVRLVSLALHISLCIKMLPFADRFDKIAKWR